MRKPTPQELEQLRAAYPEGAPRIDYRETTLRIIAEGYPPGLTGVAGDDQGEGEEIDGDEELEAAADAAEDPEGTASAKTKKEGKSAGGARAVDPTQPIGLSFSSEQPVLRYDWWEDTQYYEVLDHSEKSIDFSYSRDGLPFVSSHRAWDADSQHGIVENVRLKGKQLRGDVLLSDAPQSLQIGRDMLRGIRKKVSVGYIIGDDYEQTKGGADGIPVRRYKNWMPIEVSTVPIPADYSVGIGRAQSAEGRAALSRFLELHPHSAARRAKERTVAPDNTAGQNGSADNGNSNANSSGAGTRGLSPEAQAAITEVRERQRAVEQTRVASIVQLGNQHGVNDRVEGWLAQGTSVEDVRAQINDILSDRLKKPIQQARPIELGSRDHRRFSYARVMLMQDGKLEREFKMDPESGASRNLDYGLEREILTEALSRSPIPVGAKKGGVFIPFVTQADGRDLTMGERLRELHERESYYFGRGVDSATTTTGGPFKFTQPGDFITLLRNKTSVLRAGVTVLSGLTGPVTFPKQSGPGSATWRAENPGSDVSRVDLTTTTVTLSFKTIQAAMAVSRQALFSAASGNYDLEGIIRGDLAAIIGLAIDLAGLNGLGSSNQPLGLLQDTNVGTVTLGAAGATMAWGNWVDLETAIGDANADVGTMAYLTNTKQRGNAKKTAVLGNTASGVPIWTGTPGVMDGVVNGYRAIASNQVPRNLTKGTSTTICSAVLFGVFEHLLMGVFGGGFEMLTDPYTLKLQNMVDLTAWSFIDFANRYPVAFQAIRDAL